MPVIISYLIAFISGYLIGSVPAGYLWVKVFTGQDVRKVGSGRTGGTNVLRAAGRSAFILTVLSDIAKGFVAVLLIWWWFGDPAHLVAGIGALVGNNWSLFLMGRGGAGVMTTTGTLLAISPLVTLIFIPLPLTLLVATRIASVASLTAAVLGPLWFALMVYLGYEHWSRLIYLLIAGLLLIAVHAPNIQRLRSGTERRMGEPVKKE